ncbi:MAG TPA: IS256 family transposase, partial [Mesorhizobium sp.]|nr:IS256 family transposase [Mesorhizobium sp.]
MESRALGEDPYADLLHEMIGFAAARLMEGGLTGAAWSENSPE